MRTSRVRGTVAVATTVAALAASAAARADTLTLSVSPAQPTDATQVQVTASGTASNAGDTYELFVHYQPAGGACAGAPEQDSNPPLDPDGSTFNGGPFGPLVGIPQQVQVGSYTICGWVEDLSNNNQVVAAASSPLAVGAADTISLSASPSSPVQGQDFDIDASGNSYDGASLIFATYKAANGTCAATRSADHGTPLNGDGVPTGRGSYSAVPGAIMMLSPGTYLVCAWLADQASPSVLLAHTQMLLTVRKLSPTLTLRAHGFTFTVTIANLDAGVPVDVSAYALEATHSAQCVSNPNAQKGSLVLDEQFTDTKRPTGGTSYTFGPGGGGDRVLVCAYLQGAWENGGTTTIAGPVSLAYTLPHNTTYNGRTSQRQNISFVMSPSNAILAIQYLAHLRCSGRPRLPSGFLWTPTNWQGQLSPNNFGTVKPSKTGAIKIRLDRFSYHKFDLTATLKNGRISGVFSEYGRVWAFTGNKAQHFNCSTGRVKFSAKP